MRFLALIDGNSALRQDCNRCRCRNGKASVGALDKSVSFGDRTGDDPGFAEQFQADTSSDDLDD